MSCYNTEEQWDRHMPNFLCFSSLIKKCSSSVLILKSPVTSFERSAPVNSAPGIEYEARRRQMVKNPVALSLDHWLNIWNFCRLNFLSLDWTYMWSLYKGSLALQKRMNFQKSSKRPLTLPPSFSKNHVADFFPKFMTEVPFIMAKICSKNFWIRNDPLPPSELFRKFICFGMVTHP